MVAKCNVCGKEFEAARSDAKFCSPKCRVQNHRRKANPDMKPRPRRPLPDAFGDASYQALTVTQRLMRLAKDDRLPRERKQLNEGPTVRNLKLVHAALERVIAALDPDYGADLACAREIMEMSKLAEDQFEAALSAAREQGDVSRANIIAIAKSN